DQSNKYSIFYDMAYKTTTTHDGIQQTKPFASIEQEAIVSLLRTANFVHLQYEHLVQKEGITIQQYNILRILRGADQPLPTMEIGDRLVEKTPGITRLLDRLEEKNLIKRNRCPHDRRQVLCCITDQALILLDRLEKPVDSMDKTSLVGLDHAQLSALLILLQRIRQSASL
ncbi:MAG: MarR family transcriptional regulator, partial [Candidatus Latescibacteria bacterium]|nr:MarR family transcriptional regulator [Candidatus Latescibacterota bacterium]